MIFYYGHNYDNYDNSFQKTTEKKIFIRKILCKQSGKAERVVKIKIN